VSGVQIPAPPPDIIKESAKNTPPSTVPAILSLPPLSIQVRLGTHENERDGSLSNRENFRCQVHRFSRERAK
jgi:hypothetical protein